MDTPPTTAAVMIVSSRFDGTVDWITCNCVANSTEAMPANMPWIANTITTVGAVRMPAARAASAFEPRA